MQPQHRQPAVTPVLDGSGGNPGSSQPGRRSRRPRRRAGRGRPADEHGPPASPGWSPGPYPQRWLPTGGQTERWRPGVSSSVGGLDHNDVRNGDVRLFAVALQDDVIDPNGTNSARSGAAGDASNPDGFTPILGIKQSITDRAAPSQGDGGRLLFGFED